MARFRFLLVLAAISLVASPVVHSGWATVLDGGPTVGIAERLLGKGERGKEDKNADKENDLAGNSRNSDKGKKFGDERNQANNNDNGMLKEGDVDDQKNAERTSLGAMNQFELQGFVTALNCEAQPKEITITTVDGSVLLRHMIDKNRGDYDHSTRVDLLKCGDLAVGDYLFVQEAEKQNEHLYDAFILSCTAKRDDERRNNSNDNDEIDDPNCRLILGRPNVN
jgi:hypothetical protein